MNEEEGARGSVTFRSQDRGTWAVEMPLKYRGVCETCRASLAAGERALVVSKKQPTNTTGRTIIFCVPCIPSTVFEMFRPARLSKPLDRWTEKAGSVDGEGL